jgi:hypothetical protein
MAKRTEFEKILKTSVISAFTFAVALIWRDFFVVFVEHFVPQSNAIYYQLVFAILVTLIVAVAIYVFVRTEREAEYLFNKIKIRNRRKKK